MDYGVQLGRRFRALKAWVVWRSFGREGMAATIREHLRLANLFAEWIENDKRFQLAAPVVMPVVCFRLVGYDEASRRSVPPVRLGPKADVNSEIVKRINASGRLYITQTKLRDRTVMRIGLGNVLTTEHHVRRAWELIQSVANEVSD
jgi:aromatic-L-amino-acid/L-tryptophan decarboxylase